MEEQTGLMDFETSLTYLTKKYDGVYSMAFNNSVGGVKCKTMSWGAYLLATAELTRIYKEHPELLGFKEELAGKFRVEQVDRIELIEGLECFESEEKYGFYGFVNDTNHIDYRPSGATWIEKDKVKHLLKVFKEHFSN